MYPCGHLTLGPPVSDMFRPAYALCLATLTSALLLQACGDPDDGDSDSGDVVEDATDVRAEVGRDIFTGDTPDVGVDPDATTEVGDDADDDATPGDAGSDADSDADTGTTGPSVGPEGGRINFPGGYLDVPAGAVENLTEITITKANVFPAGVVVSGDIWRFEPAGLEFALPVDACFFVSGVRPANTSVFWSAMGEERDVAPIPAFVQSGHLCGKTDHFSIGFMAAWDDDQCSDVDCPAGEDVCNGNVLQLRGLATCRDGECSYEPATVSCSAAGGSCQDGACVGPAECGNDRREGDERCDGSDLGGARCADFGFISGPLGCNDDCTYDDSSCSGDRCDSINCDPGPAFCEGDVSVVRTGSSCEFGSCLWDEERTDCTVASNVCVDGLCIDAPSEGDLVITEFMANPTGNEEFNEWFEVRCDADEPMSLRGLVVSDDGSDSFRVDADITLEPGEYFVFAGSADATADVGYVWDDFRLSNSGDEIVLTLTGRRIDRVGYTSSWHGGDGYATSLKPEATDNGSRTSWCTTLAPAYRGSDFGTPGAVNPSCDTVCGDGNRQGDEQCDDGNTELDDGCDADCRIEVDECDGVRCDDPPAGSCDGNTAVVFDPAGTCEEGEGTCLYTEVRTACDDLECFRGACIRTLSRGDLVITEFLARPSGSNNEFFEVYNASGEDIDLRGLEIHDFGVDSMIVTADDPVMVAAGEYFVFGDGVMSGGGEVGWSWDRAEGDFVLANGGDEIVLTMNEIIIDEVDYDRVSITNLDSVTSSLDPSALGVNDNDLGANWCSGVGAYDTAGNQGTPGAANPPCPGCGDNILQASEECDDGNNANGDGCASDCTLEPIPDCEEDVDCDAPPAPSCDGDEVVTYALPGTCADGGCSYATTREDCTTVEGGRCGAGACYVAVGPFPGDVIITEMLVDPDGGDANKEWFEITNVSETTVDLFGMEVSDLGIDDFIVNESLVLAPNGVAVLAGPNASFGSEPEFRWAATEMALSNSSDEIVLTLDGVELDRVVYTNSWPIPDGYSYALDPDSYTSGANNDRLNWCRGEGTYGPTDNRGTPGVLNPSCD